MKTKLTLLAILITLATFTTQSQKVTTDQKTPQIANTKWKLVSSKDMKLPEGYSQFKFYTKNSFFWYLSTPEGEIIRGAGGDYKLEGNICTEVIKNHIGSDTKHFVGMGFPCRITMLPDGKMKSEITIYSAHEEIWEKVE